MRASENVIQHENETSTTISNELVRRQLYNFSILKVHFAIDRMEYSDR